MDRRTLLAVVLSLAIWYGWLAIFKPPPPPPEEGAQTTAQGTDQGTAPGQPTPQPGVAANTPLPEPPAEEMVVPFEACGATGFIGTHGGRLHDLTLPKYEAAYHVTPLYSWIWGRVTGSIEGPWKPYGSPPGPETLLSKEAQGLAVGVGNQSVPLSVVNPESPTKGTVELQGQSAGVAVTQRFTEHREGDSCWIAVDVSFTNQGQAPASPFMGLHDHPGNGPDGQRKKASSYDTQRQPMLLVDGDVYYGGVLGAGCVRQGTQLSDALTAIGLEGPVSWFAMADRYFGLFAVPPESSPATATLTRIGEGDEAIDGTIFRWPDLAPGGTISETFKVYVGPNHSDALEAVDPSLGRAVDLGWSAFFGYPLLWLLRVFYSWVGNWGVAIILLTFAVKAVFFPMTQRGMKSMQRMQAIQPELAAIKEKHADNPAEMNRLTIELMQKHQVNPLAGCLPTLVQIPVWIALYQVILTSPDLYQTEFLYLRDLSSPDPTLILPILVMGLMWLQQQLSTPPNMDPVQQQVMKLMPLMVGLFFFAAPSGLAVYMLVNITLSILQQWLIKRSLGSASPPVDAPAS